MGSNARVAMAVGLGYLLGRRKKMRTAVAVGAAIAAGRFSRDPMSLLQRGGELLGNSSVLGQVSGLTKPLTAAGKAAAAGVVSRQIDSVGDRIKRRADALRLDGDQLKPQDTQRTGDRSGERDVDEPAEHHGNGRAKPSGQDGRESVTDLDDEYDADDYDDVEVDGDEPSDEQDPMQRRAPAGDGSPARRAGRAAPVRR